MSLWPLRRDELEPHFVGMEEGASLGEGPGKELRGSSDSPHIESFPSGAERTVNGHLLKEENSIAI